MNIDLKFHFKMEPKNIVLIVLVTLLVTGLL